MIDSNLYIVGTIHNDPYGKVRLDALLKHLSPSIIALEMSDNRDDLTEYHEFLKKSEEIISFCIEESDLKLNSTQIQTFIDSVSMINNIMGYELLSSQEYISSNLNSKLEYIDLSLFVNRNDDSIEALKVTYINLFNKCSLDSEYFDFVFGNLDNGIDGCRKDLILECEQGYSLAEQVDKKYKKVIGKGTSESEKANSSSQDRQTFESVYDSERDKFMDGRVRELYDGEETVVVIVGLVHLYGLKDSLKDLNPNVMTLADSESFI